MSAARLAVADLAIERAERLLLARLSFDAVAGDIVHLAGANGSGKTTLLRTLAGLVAPAAGTIRWNGETVCGSSTLQGDLAFIGHAPGLSAELSARENLDFAARLAATRDPAAVDRALRHFQLGALADRASGRLSAGQRQRAALARLLLAPRPLWMLDEPFTSLDAGARAILATAIDQHVAGGGIVLVATHQPFDTRAAQRTVSLEGYA